MIEVRQLRKAFGLRPVLRGVDLDVGPGECLALLGPNGAGKTTLMRILCTLASPTTGQVRVAGLPLPAAAGEVRRRLGVVAHHTLLYADLTAEENLQLYSRLYALRNPAPRIAAVLEQVGLARRARDLVRTLSRGMQQRLAIARALLPDPAVLLMDEPFTGLDPINTNMIQDEIFRLKNEGVTIIFSTHRMEQVEEMCENIILIHHGKNILFGNVREIRHTYKENLYEVGYKGELPKQFSGGLQFIREQDHKAVFSIPEQDTPNHLLQFLISSGCEIQSFHEILPSINEIFIRQVKGVSHE